MNTTSFMKRSEVVSYNFMQMPRWLFDDQQNYNTLSLPAKVAYTFLFNRCQLSQHNGWVNENDEVYIIFTRDELARKMRISYKKAISCFSELQDAGLICEERRGRGIPNRIYLVKIENTPEVKDICDFESADNSNYPEITEINFTDNAAPVAETVEETAVEQTEDIASFSQKAVESEPAVRTDSNTKTVAEVTSEQVLNCQNDTSKPVNFAVQDLSFVHPNYINKNNINTNHKKNQSVDSLKKRKEDSILLKGLLKNCELEFLDCDEQSLMKEAITWLFYANEVQIGVSCYPQESVRSRLYLIDYDVLCKALFKVYENETRIHKNVLVYTAKILFSCLTECDVPKMLNMGVSA